MNNKMISVNNGYCQDCGKKITSDNDSGLEGVLQCGEHCKALCKDCVKEWDYINLFPKDNASFIEPKGE